MKEKKKLRGEVGLGVGSVKTEAESVRGVGIQSKELDVCFLRKDVTYQSGFRQAHLFLP